jgi:hypothetical protein
MPNWCHNYMTVTGPADEVARFKQTCIRIAYEGEPAQLDFNAIAPMPEIFADDPGERWFANPDAPENRDAVMEQKARETRCLEATGFAHTIDWAIEHWGTSWNACHFHVTGPDEPDRYECMFDTAWSPPVPIWEKMGEMFPALDFTLSGHEEMGQSAFKGSIHQGRLELRKVPVMWAVVDPKTGETVTGTFEEIEDVLGKEGDGAYSMWAGEPSGNN